MFFCFQKSTELKIDPSDDFFADEPLSPRLIQSEPSQPPSEPSQSPSKTGSKMESGSRSASNGKPKRVRVIILRKIIFYYMKYILLYIILNAIHYIYVLKLYLALDNEIVSVSLSFIYSQNSL